MKKKWVFLIIICIGFIIIQSMIPEPRSYRESAWFTKNIVNPIMAYFHITLDKDFVRKTAHVFEYFVLTLVVFLYWKKTVKTFYAGFTLAFLDETLQIFTGRGTLVSDIWIDLIGVVIDIGLGKAILERKR